MVDFLVRLLETGLESLDNPAATKAQIVKALKAMQNSLKYGEEVSHEVVFFTTKSNNTTGICV